MRKYPTINPSLTLDFSKAGRFHPAFATSRAGISRVLSEEGKIITLQDNQLRPWVNPETLKVEGYRPSPAITNLLPHSLGLNAPIPTGSLGTSLGTAIATTPDGQTTTIFKTGTTNSEHMLFDERASSAADKKYVCSFFVKKGLNFPEGYGVGIRIAQSASGSTVGKRTEVSCSFRFVGDDLVLFKESRDLGGAISGYRVKLADGWFRIWMIFTPEWGDELRVRGQFTFNDSFNFAGDGNTNIFAHGWQFEVGEFPGNYVQTTGAQATQPAEGMQIISDVSFNDAEGTLIVEYIQPIRNNGWSDIAMLCTWPYVRHQRYEFISSPTGEVYSHRLDDTSGYLFRKPAPAPGTLVRAAINYTPTHVGQFFNGQGEMIPRTGKSQFHITSLAVGASFSGGAPGSSANTLIKRLSYYGKALSTREMIDITS